MIWFTSDNHFGHSNIIRYCNRPFKDRAEMNETMIRNWNSVVKPEDEVYHLGDVSFLNNEWTGSILGKLQGTIYHLRGNHDKNLKTDRFAWSGDSFYLQMIWQEKPLELFLQHYPTDVWPGQTSGSLHLHGHSHGTRKSGGAKRLDVGVDLWNFTPIGVDTILGYFGGKIEPKWATPELTEYRKTRKED